MAAPLLPRLTVDLHPFHCTVSDIYFPILVSIHHLLFSVPYGFTVLCMFAIACAGFAYIFFRFKAKKISYFSLSFALSEYERRALIPVLWHLFSLLQSSLTILCPFFPCLLSPFPCLLPPGRLSPASCSYV
jgi:hypothetical protein